MKFRGRLWVVIVAIVAVCQCALVMWLAHRRDCQPCNHDDPITSTIQPRTISTSYSRWSTVANDTYGRGLHTDVQPKLRLDGWILDCITWNKRYPAALDSSRRKREFTLDATSLPGPNENAEKRRKLFQRIFDTRDWPAADDPLHRGLKASGPGALLHRAQGVIATLHGIVTRLRSALNHSSISLLDIPCGDLQWMSHFLYARPDVVYTGADIVPEIVLHHRRKFKRANVTFIELDVVTTPLRHAYDLILVRDMLQHLWIADALTALQRLSSSGSRYLLVTTFPDTTHNEDVDRETSGGGRKSSYNLQLPPFLLESPICLSFDWNTELLGLWPLPLKQIEQ